MDILDSLTKPQPQKHSKNKTSILSSIPQTYTRSPPHITSHFKNNASNARSSANSNINSQEVNVSQYRNSTQKVQSYKPSLLVNRNQHASYQHLKELHFDYNTLSVIGSNLGSNKDAHSVSDNGPKHIVAAGQSLGVIQSQNSQDSKQGQNIQVPRSRSSKPPTITPDNSQLKQQIKQKDQQLQQLDNKIKDLQVSLKNKDKQLQIKDKYIDQLKKRVDAEYRKGLEERNKMVEEYNKNMDMCMKRTANCYQEEANNKQHMLRWESNKRQELLNQQINQLKTTINRYQSLLQSQSQFIKHMKIKTQTLQQNKTQANDNNKHDSYICTQCKFPKNKTLSLQIDKQLAHKQLQQQRFRINKQRISMEAQFRRKVEQSEKEIESTRRSLQRKQRELMETKWGLEAEKQLLEKERQQFHDMHSKWTSQHKISMQELNKEKQRVFELQKQLLQKMQIVQLYNRNRPKTSPKAAVQLLSVSPPKKQNQQKQNNEKVVKQMPNMLTSSKVNVKNYLNQINKACNPATKGKGRSIYRLLQFYS